MHLFISESIYFCSSFELKSGGRSGDVDDQGMCGEITIVRVGRSGDVDDQGMWTIRGYAAKLRLSVLSAFQLCLRYLRKMEIQM